MFDAIRLKEVIDERDLSIAKIAVMLDMHRSTLYRKINSGGGTLTIKEANLICKILNLTGKDALAIFFKNIVA